MHRQLLRRHGLEFRVLTTGTHAPFAPSYSSSVPSSCSNRHVPACRSKCTRGSSANAAAWASAEDPLASAAGGAPSSDVDMDVASETRD